MCVSIIHVIARSVSDDPPSLALRAMARLESAEASLRVGGSNPFFLCAAKWIASRSLSSGAHSRDPLARNDDVGIVVTV
jgi:hypothetical protein